MPATNWAILILKLPGKSASTRMRVWRALKTSGAAMLRDGVYVLPETGSHVSAFNEQRAEVRKVGGSAYVLSVPDTAFHDGSDLRPLFDRSDLYEDWLGAAIDANDQLDQVDEPGARSLENRLRRELEGIVAVDFFAAEAQQAAVAKLAELNHAVNARFSPAEPSQTSGSVKPVDVSEFINRVWATRADLWIDRVASAWLIQQFVDPKAAFLWLTRPEDCPATAVGFDFDGATFSHVGSLVTFQVLLRAFKLETNQALTRIGQIVRYLDIGGPSVNDAAGVLSLLSGAKRLAASDDGFLQQASPLFDQLYSAYADGREK